MTRCLILVRALVVEGFEGHEERDGDGLAEAEGGQVDLVGEDDFGAAAGAEGLFGDGDGDAHVEDLAGHFALGEEHADEPLADEPLGQEVVLGEDVAGVEDGVEEDVGGDGLDALVGAREGPELEVPEVDGHVLADAARLVARLHALEGHDPHVEALAAL